MNSKDKNNGQNKLGITEYGQMEDNLSDISLYGEFVSTFHHWVSSEEQRGNAEHLQNLGRKNK